MKENGIGPQSFNEALEPTAPRLHSSPLQEVTAGSTIPHEKICLWYELVMFLRYFKVSLFPSIVKKSNGKRRTFSEFALRFNHAAMRFDDRFR